MDRAMKKKSVSERRTERVLKPFEILNKVRFIRCINPGETFVDFRCINVDKFVNDQKVIDAIYNKARSEMLMGLSDKMQLDVRYKIIFTADVSIYPNEPYDLHAIAIILEEV